MSIGRISTKKVYLCINPNPAIMSLRLIQIVMLCVVLIATGAVVAYGQDDAELDYRQYKFYTEEEDEENNLWLIAVDRTNDNGYNVTLGDHAPNTNYTLSMAGYSRRGMGYDERRYLAGGLSIDYTTARQLRSLGLKRNTAIGLTNSALSGATAETEGYFHERTDYYNGHYLCGEFSGRNYLGGISHRARYKPTKQGVMLKDGWSFAHYARARTGRDLYVDGVYTNALDVAAIASYSDRRNWLNIAILLPMSERGLRSASVEEAYTLTDNPRYNPSWGMQDGKMRNSRVATSLRPEILAHWQHRISVTTDLRLTANINFEQRGYTSLAWFNARTPAPDNYRYLPSYHADDEQAREVRDAWQDNNLSYTQIAWDELYHTNAIQRDGAARYAVENRRENNIRAATSALFKSRIGDVDVEYGLRLDYYTSREFKIMDDLLGADHIVDIDYYLIDDATYSNALQNNLREPDMVITEGCRFGYDYRLTRWSTALYGSVLREWEAMTLRAELNVGLERTRRHGYYEKELFAGSGSYGKSKSLTTNPYRINIAWQYRLNNHTFVAAAMLRGESPDREDMFLQTQYNNRAVEDYGLATTLAIDLSYHYVAPRIALTATLFMATTANDSRVVHYYDDLATVYSDAVIRAIGRTHFGLEASADIRWSQYFSSTFSLTAARYRYTRDAEVRLYADTNNDLIAASHAKMRGYNSGSPELAAYSDIAFRHSGWMARMALGYCGLRYVEPSFVRRTERIVSFAQSPEEADILKSQQRLPDAFSLNLSLSKRIKLKNRTSLYVQLSANNLLGSSFIRDGYEQNRIRRTIIQNRTHVAPFANRLTYDYPRTFYLAVALWF